MVIAQLVNNKKCEIAQIEYDILLKAQYGIGCLREKDISLLKLELALLENYSILNLNKVQLDFLKREKYSNIYKGSTIINNIPTIEVNQDVTEITNIYTKTTVNSSPVIEDNWDKIDW